MQLPLPVRLPDDASFANFLPHPRAAAALGQLRAALERPAMQACLHGSAGSGRSHLLQASCHERQQRGEAIVYLPLDTLAAYPPAEVLHGLEEHALVCLDDLDAVAGRADWEEALFHFCNRVQQHGTKLLVSASAPPAMLGIALADLRSRLQAMLVLALGTPGDEDKLAVLQFRAGKRGLQLTEEVARYLLARAPRDLPALLEVLEGLDRASLATARRLSIPFVREHMGWRAS